MSLASDPELQKKIFDDGTGSDLLQPVGQFDRGIMALAAEEMRERQFFHLRARGFGEFGIAMPQRRAPQAGHAFEIGFAAGVVDPHALPALDDERTAGGERIEVRIGMNERRDIASGKIAGHGVQLCQMDG